MALFFPDLHSKNLKLTPGERRFATSLVRNLEDDYHVWVNVPVGARQLRPDFVVLHPGRGILTLEVKDWKLPTIQSVDRMAWTIHTDRGPKTEISPLEQARGYAIAIKEMLERDPLLICQDEGRYRGHLLFPWGFGVVLTNITRKQFLAAGLEAAIAPERVICQDEIQEGVEAEAFQERLWGMFQYSFGGVLSLARIDRIRWHLFPEIRIQQGNLFTPPAEAPDPNAAIAAVLPDVVKVMDLQQEKVARNLGQGHRIVHGVAGSGKTLLLAFRCMHLREAAQGKPILVLCFNKTLAARLQDMLAERGAGDGVHIRHFHGWCKDMCALYQLDLPAANGRNIWDLQVEAVIAGAESGRVPRAQYAAILIDEGHDFEPDWFRLLVQMLDPETNSLLLLYDDTQNIYGKAKKRAFTWASVGIQAAGRTTILKKNYRNTVEALDFSYHFLTAYVDEQGTEEVPVVTPELGGRRGTQPEVVRAASVGEEFDRIAAWIEARLAEGYDLREIAILCNAKWQIAQVEKELRRRNIRASDNDPRVRAEACVRILTMHSSKGLEFRGVIIFDLGFMPHPKLPVEDEARLLYVAMTRSTERLLVTYHRESEFTRQCERLAGNAAGTAGQGASVAVSRLLK